MWIRMTTTAATLTVLMWLQYACDVRPRESTAAVPVNHLSKVVTAHTLDSNATATGGPYYYCTGSDSTSTTTNTTLHYHLCYYYSHEYWATTVVVYHCAITINSTKYSHIVYRASSCNPLLVCRYVPCPTWTHDRPSVNPTKNLACLFSAVHVYVL